MGRRYDEVEDWGVQPCRRYPGASVVKGLGKGLGVLCWPATALVGLTRGRRRGEFEVDDFDALAADRHRGWVEEGSQGGGGKSAARVRPSKGRRRRDGVGSDLRMAWGAAPGLTASAVLLAVLRAAARVGVVVLLGYAVEHSALNDAFDIGMGGRCCCPCPC